MKYFHKLQNTPVEKSLSNNQPKQTNHRTHYEYGKHLKKKKIDSDNLPPFVNNFSVFSNKFLQPNNFSVKCKRSCEDISKILSYDYAIIPATNKSMLTSYECVASTFTSLTFFCSPPLRKGSF
jgi:hypothetical protein